MKRFLLSLLLIPFLLGGCNQNPSSGETEQEQHSINVPINEVSLTEGQQFEIPIEIITPTSIIYRSNDEEIATVSRQGVITAIKEGETTISITGGKDRFLLFVTVLADMAKSSLQIVMPKTNFILAKDDEYVLPLTVKYAGEEVENPVLSYEYENEGIVTISSLTVTALNVGTTKCVVTATFEELEISEMLSITVY